MNKNQIEPVRNDLVKTTSSIPIEQQKSQATLWTYLLGFNDSSHPTGVVVEGRRIRAGVGRRTPDEGGVAGTGKRPGRGRAGAG